MRLAAALAAALSLLGAGPARAQVSNNQIAYGAVTRAPVGSWAEYLITKDGQQSVRVRYTLVARDARRIALEVDSQTPVGRVLVRMEFTPDKKEATRWNLAAARMRMPDGEQRDMPVPAQSDARSASFGKGDAFGQRVGHEEVTVPAGHFGAEHHRRSAGGATTDVWMDEHVLPVGLVKLTDGQGGTVELAAVGTGAKK